MPRDESSIVDAIREGRLNIAEIRADWQAERATLITYLKSRLSANDLHAVQDAASDIREIDAKLELLKELYG